MDTDLVQAKKITSSVEQKYQVFIKDGVMYHVFLKEFSPQIALDLQEEALDLLKQKRIYIIPLIVDLRDVTETTFKIGMGEYSQVVTSKDMIKHASGIWIVGAKGKMKSIGHLINKVFFGNRIHIVDTIEEAETGAHAALADPRPILEY